MTVLPPYFTGSLRLPALSGTEETKNMPGRLSQPKSIFFDTLVL